MPKLRASHQHIGQPIPQSCVLAAASRPPVLAVRVRGCQQQYSMKYPGVARICSRLYSSYAAGKGSGVFYVD
jgi:hypothetical protein